MDYHDIGVTICNTVDKCCPTTLTEEQRTELIGAVAVWLDKQHKKGREAGMMEAAGLCEKRADFIRGQQSGPQDELSNVILRHHASAHREAMESILSAIEGAK